MKKDSGKYSILYCFLCALLLLGPGCDKPGPGRPEKVYGTVISIDEAKKEIIMKDGATGSQRTITARSAEQLTALKPGMAIKAKVREGTGLADTIAPKAHKEAGRKAGQKDGNE